jgi:hypothetical protein
MWRLDRERRNYYSTIWREFLESAFKRVEVTAVRTGSRFDIRFRIVKGRRGIHIENSPISHYLNGPVAALSRFKPLCRL